ncbi:MICOS complex subunit MIC19 [Candida viswanathii]|jgi:altered-inheritance-of-mitochondria protein 13|uniref:MICOS complex subunit MIC19 n=1 Tax=Candida viswanathii TaxID=5486 RepID=A0A367XR39_9ASCO|nr:MICOS complex subunit MIC19 [Candida viswanathii]
MGSSTSKPETKVFTPDTPIDFSATFLSQLETSPESDFSRAQYTEKYIQDRVAVELARLEKETIKNFKNTTEKALLKADKEDTKLSVAAANEKITNLTDLLKKNAVLAQVVIPPTVQEARESVVKCLKDNQGRSLNCWDEVETFKQLVKEL